MSRPSFHRTTRLPRAALALALLAPALALTIAPAPLAAAGSAYLPADEAVARTAQFDYVGAEQTFVVPNGVHQIDVDAIGAPGGVTSDQTPGGRGAKVTATLAVEPGDVLYVRVGGAGSRFAGGWNGGGNAVLASSESAFGGGGASDLRTCGTSDPDCSPLDSRIVVAAGGGGAGLTCCVDGNRTSDLAAGDAGVDAPDYTGVRGSVGGGHAATASAGGAGGVDSSYSNPGGGNGDPGTYGAGGAGRYVGTPYQGAGGGGGGLYGGGGGGTGQYYGAGGGGGSSLVPEGGTLAVVERAVSSQVSISYDAGPVTDVGVVVADPTIVATGADSTTVTATASLEDGTKVPGLEVVFESTDAGQSFGPVSDHGDGTYSATLTGSTAAGEATVTATAKGSTPTYDVSGSIDVTTEGYALTVEPVTDTLVATGADSLTVSARAESLSGTPLAGLPVTFETSDAGQAFGAVADHGDGTYSATLRGSTTSGSATVTAVAAGAGEPTLVRASVTTEGYSVTVRPIDGPILGTGAATVTAVARSASQVPLPGLEVSFVSSDPGQSLGATTDNQDGTYSATLRGTSTPGVARIRAVVAGAGTPSTPEVELVTARYDKPSITASTASSTPSSNGWFRTPVTVTFACTGTLPLIVACPTPVVLGADGRDQVVTRTVTDSLGTTATATSAAVSVDATSPSVSVTGARKGATYKKLRKLTCKATDALSGVASCVVAVTKKKKSKKLTIVRWTATALDRAGNPATSKGQYKVKKKTAQR